MKHLLLFEFEFLLAKIRGVTESSRAELELSKAQLRSLSKQLSQP